MSWMLSHPKSTLTPTKRRRQKRHLKTDALRADDTTVAKEDHDNDNAMVGSIPHRDMTQLYAYKDTVDCAQSSCVPCAYKVGAFDVALDTNFCRAVPNQRPEQCRRLVKPPPPSSSSSNSSRCSHTTAPPSVLRILTVGDGDFSFSLALARHGGCHVVATSYESKDTLERVYDEGNLFSSTVHELEQDYNATICYAVDATRLKDTLPPSVLLGSSSTEATAGAASGAAATTSRSNKSSLFDRIVWNFPCSAVSNGQDGQNAEMDHNKELVRSFVHAAVPLLNPVTGQIHMHHKTKPPFDQWNLPELVVVANNNTFVYLGRIVLDRALFPPYVPRKALDRKSFSCHDACTFVFGLATADTKTTVQQQLSTAAAHPYPTQRQSLQLVPVTMELVDSIRSTHLKLQTNKKNGRCKSHSQSRHKKRRKKK